MTEAWVVADRIFDGVAFHTGHALRLRGGRVAALVPAEAVPAEAPAAKAAIVAPGFLDIQVNGGGGVLLNSTPTPEGLAAIAAAHRAAGTVALLPTVITDAPPVLAAAVDAVLAARAEPGILGLHIEGPHISLARRGTHAAAHIRPLDANTLNHVRRLTEAGCTALITLAPEAATISQVRELAAMGAIVALGHSDAPAEQALAYLDAGATGVTHLFNAMSPLLSRAPGLVGAALASDAWCSVIADGHHVDPLSLRLACQARALPDRMIAISDAMPTVGGPEAFDLYGQTIRLSEGRLINAEGALAGAHLTMVEAVRNLIGYGLDPASVLRMARANPAAFLQRGGFETLIGTPIGDVVTLDESFQVTGVGIAPPVP